MTTIIDTAKALEAGLLQRIAPANKPLLDQLGLLSEFPGVWVGTGFNVIFRPNRQNHGIFFLQLSPTVETLEFSPIGGAVPNRGSLQNDIFLHGIHYLQRVSDASSHAPLHIEPGFWMHVPATTQPPQAETYVRQSTIPHGDSLIAPSTFFKALGGGPTLSAVDATPFLVNLPIPGLNAPNPVSQFPLGYLDPFINPTSPPGMPALPPGISMSQVVKNPVLLLQQAIQEQHISHTTVIQVSTAGSSEAVGAFGGIVNIPFVNKNASTVQVDAIFWIETVQTAADTSFQQLQYVQRVMLDFDGVHWPHFSVATLVKQ